MFFKCIVCRNNIDNHHIKSDCHNRKLCYSCNEEFEQTGYATFFDWLDYKFRERNKLQTEINRKNKQIRQQKEILKIKELEILENEKKIKKEIINDITIKRNIIKKDIEKYKEFVEHIRIMEFKLNDISEYAIIKKYHQMFSKQLLYNIKIQQQKALNNNDNEYYSAFIDAEEIIKNDLKIWFKNERFKEYKNLLCALELNKSIVTTMLQQYIAELNKVLLE